MDQRMTELGSAFEGSDVRWHLDGALNISLLRGLSSEGEANYIGYHKDVDLSVEKADLEKMEAQLLAHGYGFFLSTIDAKTGEKIERRVGYKTFGSLESEHRLVCAIDENGGLVEGAVLSAVDLHLITRDEEGQALGIHGVPIPEKWVQPYPIDFKGHQINISHPGKILYYKLHQGRDYDFTDIDRLVETGKLTVEDVDDVAEAYEKEFKANLIRARKRFAPISAEITADTTPEQIADLFFKDEEFSRAGEANRPTFVELGKRLLASGDTSVDNMITIAVDLFKAEEQNDVMRQKIVKIRKKVEAQGALKSVRKKMAS